MLYTLSLIIFLWCVSQKYLSEDLPLDVTLSHDGTEFGLLILLWLFCNKSNCCNHCVNSVLHIYTHTHTYMIMFDWPYLCCHLIISIEPGMMERLLISFPENEQHNWEVNEVPGKMCQIPLLRPFSFWHCLYRFGFFVGLDDFTISNEEQTRHIGRFMFYLWSNIRENQFQQINCFSTGWKFGAFSSPSSL